MSDSRAQDKLIKRIRAVQKGFHKANRTCFTCTQRGPNHICVSFSTFACDTCAGILREFSFRVKSISLSTWTEAEVADLEKGGNHYAASKYMRGFDPERKPAPSNANGIRELIEDVLVAKKYTQGRRSSPSEGSNRERRDDRRRDKREKKSKRDKKSSRSAPRASEDDAFDVDWHDASPKQAAKQPDPVGVDDDDWANFSTPAPAAVNTGRPSVRISRKAAPSQPATFAAFSAPPGSGTRSSAAPAPVAAPAPAPAPAPAAASSLDDLFGAFDAPPAPAPAPVPAPAQATNPQQAQQQQAQQQANPQPSGMAAPKEDKIADAFAALDMGGPMGGGMGGGMGAGVPQQPQQALMYGNQPQGYPQYGSPQYPQQQQAPQQQFQSTTAQPNFNSPQPQAGYMSQGMGQQQQQQQKQQQQQLLLQHQQRVRQCQMQIQQMQQFQQQQIRMMQQQKMPPAQIQQMRQMQQQQLHMAKMQYRQAQQALQAQQAQQQQYALQQTQQAQPQQQFGQQQFGSQQPVAAPAAAPANNPFADLGVINTARSAPQQQQPTMGASSAHAAPETGGNDFNPFATPRSSTSGAYNAAAAQQQPQASQPVQQPVQQQQQQPQASSNPFDLF